MTTRQKKASSTDSPPGPAPRKAMLFEVSWEVCRQVGGIYTVIRSKAPAMVEQWGNRYCLIGPWDDKTSPVEFEEMPPSGHVGRAIRALRARGIEAHYGRWLVTGQPRTILLDLRSASGQLPQIKYTYWHHHDIPTPPGDPMVDAVLAFGYLIEQFFRELVQSGPVRRRVIAHFHEWQAAAAIPGLRRENLPVSVVFTTHATLLGRYIAAGDEHFYDRLGSIDWLAEAQRMNVEPQGRLERAAAHGAHVLTTLSEITADECRAILGRSPEVLLPNGLNIERFVAMHEFQNLHQQYKQRINQFVMATFFPSYTFDLDKTLYVFSSGRYEYHNKGYDLTLEAMARLNLQLKAAASEQTVIFFLVTRRPQRCINAEVLSRVAMLEELRRTCESVTGDLGEELFEHAAAGEIPDLNALVTDYWQLRLKRLLYARKSEALPAIVTHDLLDDQNDDVLQQLRYLHLVNRPEDRVKVVYHPEFVTADSPLLGMDYDQFVRGCHLGVFPSFYEPWGYTPLECVARGIPTVTSDVSGFGSYVMQNIPDYQDEGIYVLDRRTQTMDQAAAQLADWMAEFCALDRRDRIRLRNRVERAAEGFDWRILSRHYAEAHRLALAITGT